MSNRILVTPEQLEQLSAKFSQSGQQAGDLIQRLHGSMMQLEGQWDGITRERFYGEYQHARVTMNKFTECLHNVSVELNQIAGKFRTADGTASGNTAGAAVTGAAAIAGGAGMAVAAGSKPAAGGPVNVKNGKSLGDTLITGFEKEASMVENKEGGLYTKAMYANADAGLLRGGSAGVGLVEAGYENDYVEGSVSLGKAEVEASIKDGTLSVGAEATLNKYEGGIKIPLPFTDHELNIGGSASLGVVGGSAEIGKSGLKFHLPLGPGASLVGVGGSITIE